MNLKATAGNMSSYNLVRIAAMINWRLLHRGLAAFLGLSLVLGLGFSSCPAGSMASSDGNNHCADAHEQDLSACSHNLLAVEHSGPCATLGAVRCVEEAATQSQPQPQLERGGGSALEAQVAPDPLRPIISSWQLGRSSEGGAAPSVALHLLHGIWLN